MTNHHAKYFANSQLTKRLNIHNAAGQGDFVDSGYYFLHFGFEHPEGKMKRDITVSILQVVILLLVVIVNKSIVPCFSFSPYMHLFVKVILQRDKFCILDESSCSSSHGACAVAQREGAKEECGRIYPFFFQLTEEI